MTAMTFLAIIGAAVLAVLLLVPVGVGLMLLGGGVLTFTVTRRYGGVPVTVRRRFGRETGWRWVEDQHQTPWQYGAYSFDDMEDK